MNYQTNTELAEVLLKNGYKDTSKKYYSNHLQKDFGDGKKEYSMYNKLRNHNSPYIKFDYINICEYQFQFHETRISDKQLKAVICFHKLSPNIRKKLQYKYNKINHRIDDFEKMVGEIIENKNYWNQDHPGLSRAIIKAYKSIVI